MNKNTGRKLLGTLAFIAVFAASIAIVMLLWNALIPSIIGWSAINYWQAAGLMILSRLMFGGFGRFGRKFGHRRFHGRHEHNHSFTSRKEARQHFKEMNEKMKGMSRDERKEFIRDHIHKYHPEKEGFFGCDKSKTEEKED